MRPRWQIPLPQWLSCSGLPVLPGKRRERVSSAKEGAGLGAGARARRGGGRGGEGVGPAAASRNTLCLFHGGLSDLTRLAVAAAAAGVRAPPPREGWRGRGGESGEGEGVGRGDPCALGSGARGLLADGSRLAGVASGRAPRARGSEEGRPGRLATPTKGGAEEREGERPCGHRHGGTGWCPTSARIRAAGLYPRGLGGPPPLSVARREAGEGGPAAAAAERRGRTALFLLLVVRRPGPRRRASIAPPLPPEASAPPAGDVRRAPTVAHRGWTAASLASRPRQSDQARPSVGCPRGATVN